jgi:hypothetical protein
LPQAQHKAKSPTRKPLCENFKTKQMITAADYNHPLGIPSGYFNGKAVPPYRDYLSDYHIHFMRYIYFMCIMNAEGEYPVEMTMDEIQNAFHKNKGKKCRPRIKKILIGEAPPKPINYFYNPSIARWNVAKGTPTKGQGWTSAIKNTLFPGVVFPDTVSFLKACAREGFLLLDLFPYAITYSSRTSTRYRQACVSAWGVGTAPYPHNILSTLNLLTCCMKKNITIGFALKSFGEIIANNTASIASFNNWCSVNGIKLIPPGPLNQIRPATAPLASASIYRRVCGTQGQTGPNSSLLSIAGF